MGEPLHYNKEAIENIIKMLKGPPGIAGMIWRLWMRIPVRFSWLVDPIFYSKPVQWLMKIYDY